MQPFFLLWFFHDIIFVVVVFYAYSPFVISNQDEQKNIFIFLCSICITGSFAGRIEFLPSDMGGWLEREVSRKAVLFFLTACQSLCSNG